MTDPSDHRPLASFAAVAIQAGLMQPANAIAWADALINDSPTPADWMIELSLADPADPLVVLDRLKAVPGEENLSATCRLLGGLSLRRWRIGDLTPEQFALLAWRLYQADPERMSWGAMIDHVVNDFGEQHITGSRVRHIIDEELSQFETALLDLPPWA